MTRFTRRSTGADIGEESSTEALFPPSPEACGAAVSAPEHVPRGDSGGVRPERAGPTENGCLGELSENGDLGEQCGSAVCATESSVTEMLSELDVPVLAIGEFTSVIP